MTSPPLHPRSLRQRLLCVALISSSMSLSCVFSSIALADPSFSPTRSSPTSPTGSTGTRYRPPSGSRPTSPTGSTGTRGGCSQATMPLTALAPIAHTGQTSTTHPTFSWYVPDQIPYPMEFTLYESSRAGRSKPIQTIGIPRSSQGIMQLSLDPAKPGLTVGKTYRWQIAMLCNPNRPSEDVWAEATVQVVALPPEVKTALMKTSDRRQRADLYANAGFWYDALTEILADSTLKSEMLALLQDLVPLEAPPQADQLQQIIAIEQQRKPLPRDGMKN